MRGGRQAASASPCSRRTRRRSTLGAANLRKQLENVRAHVVTPVVAINAMPGDFISEHAAIREVADSMGVRSAVCTHFADGGRGAAELAEAVAEAAEEPGEFRFLYPAEASLRTKIETIATRLYGADGVDYSAGRLLPASSMPSNAAGSAACRSAWPRPSCRCLRTRSSKGAPTGWRLPVRRRVPRSEPDSSMSSAVRCVPCRDWPPNLAAERIDIDANGEVVGLA